MTKDSVKAVCSECMAELPSEWISETSKRRACPKCGANARMVSLVFSDHLQIRDQVRGRVKSNDPSLPKKKRTKQEFIAGHEPSNANNGCPHPMRVGEALRALGWVRRRDWTVEVRPPEQ